jgi:hypothetical protein
MMPNQQMKNSINEMWHHLSQVQGRKVISGHEETECLVMWGLLICICLSVFRQRNNFLLIKNVNKF